MQTTEHLTHLEREGALLADAASAGDGTEPVPGCPDWTLDDLVRHVGCVHAWARLALTGGGAPPDRDYEALAAEAPQHHGSLPGWYADRLGELLATLGTTGPDVPVWQFLGEPPGAAFWARRQAHETTIHRYDAEGAVGAVTARDPALSDDGVHEVLLMHARPSRRFVPEQPVSFGVRTTDTDHTWHLHVDGARRDVRPGPGDGRATLATGTAADLHVFLWNRPGTPPTLTGDVTLWDTWRDTARIR